MKDKIDYSDFEKIDIRVGEVVEASLPEWSEKLIRYVVDFGDEIGKRVLFSGIRKWYQPEMMIGKKLMVIVNMEYKKMGEEESQGMTIMADTTDGPVLVEADGNVPNGSVIR